MGDQEELAKLFPNTYGMPMIKIVPTQQQKQNEQIKVGVILSGGQAPGGHNVIIGLYKQLKHLNKDSQLIGFLGGPKGLMTNKYIEITEEIANKFMNLGGFHMIGSGRDKISTPEQFQMARNTVIEQKLNGLVIIGGDDSNTNACLLAEDFIQNKIQCSVVGVPKTIDRDLINPKLGLETSFGFDSSTKLYCELISNLMFDCLSAKKYWHFIKLMGRSASHIALECGVRCQANICLVGEEIKEKQMTSRQVFEYIANIVEQRSQNGKNYGICLIPEGIIEFIPENAVLIDYLNNTLIPHMTKNNIEISLETAVPLMPENIQQTFKSFPPSIQSQLLLSRDPHGNISVSSIQTESFIAEGVKQILIERQSKAKFNYLLHFFGYEGRCVTPSIFDATYCYSLGQVASILIQSKKSGYMATMRHLSAPISQWRPYGLPLTSLMNVETRCGVNQPVIMKQMVDLNGNVFKYFDQHRKQWEQEDCYLEVGGIQYLSDGTEAGNEIVNQCCLTMKLENQ